MIRTLECRSPLRRAGFTLTELLIAIMLLSTALLLTAQLARVTSAQRRATHEREIALSEADSLLERLTSLPVARLTPEYLESQTLSAAGERLPGARLKIQAADLAAPSGKRLQVQLDWLLPSGTRSAPVTLTAWVHVTPPPQGGPAP